LARVAVVTAALAGACKPVAESCRTGTLLLAVTLDDNAAVADELLVNLSIDGGTARQSSLPHTPGQASGNIEVQFPPGYPPGSAIAVDVAAFAAGTLIGVGQASATLVAGCQATQLSVQSSAVAANDLSMATEDDLASPPDLTPPPPDLTPPPPDMA